MTTKLINAKTMLALLAFLVSTKMRTRMWIGFFGLAFPFSVMGQDMAQLSMRARINLYDKWEFDSAAFYFDKVIGKKYTPAFAYSDYGWFLILLDKKEEGFKYIEQAAEMSPEDRQLTSWNSWAILWQGDLLRAQHWADKALNIDPNYGEALHLSSIIASELKHHKEAIEFAERAAISDSIWRASVPLALVKAGQPQKAMDMANKIAKTENVYDAMLLMEVYGYLKNMVKTLEYMQKSYDLKHPYMPWLHFVPGIKHLHGHPQYQSIIKKMNLPK